MSLRMLDPREIDDLCDTIEENISQNIKEDIRFKMALIKSDMIAEIVSALGGAPRHVGT